MLSIFLVMVVNFKTRKNGKDQEAIYQDTHGKVTKTQLDITDEKQEVSSFPAGGHKASITGRVRKHNKHKTEIT